MRRSRDRGGGVFKHPPPSRSWKIQRPSRARVNKQNSVKYRTEGNILEHGPNCLKLPVMDSTMFPSPIATHPCCSCSLTAVSPVLISSYRYLTWPSYRGNIDYNAITCGGCGSPISLCVIRSHLRQSPHPSQTLPPPHPSQISPPPHPTPRSSSASSVWLQHTETGYTAPVTSDCQTCRPAPARPLAVPTPTRGSRDNTKVPLIEPIECLPGRAQPGTPRAPLFSRAFSDWRADWMPPPADDHLG